MIPRTSRGRAFNACSAGVFALHSSHWWKDPHVRLHGRLDRHCKLGHRPWRAFRHLRATKLGERERKGLL
jgi:hypothetical protein